MSKRLDIKKLSPEKSKEILEKIFLEKDKKRQKVENRLKKILCEFLHKDENGYYLNTQYIYGYERKKEYVCYSEDGFGKNDGYQFVTHYFVPEKKRNILEPFIKKYAIKERGEWLSSKSKCYIDTYKIDWWEEWVKTITI
jgi:hypothetical protein